MDVSQTLTDMRDVKDAYEFMKTGVEAIGRRYLDVADSHAIAAINDYANQVRELAEQLMRKCEEIEARTEASNEPA